MPDAAILLAGVPATNKAVFHRVRFAPHDPVAWIGLPGGRTVMIVRDVELPRAVGRADDVHAYEDFAPASGLGGDRGVRAAQAVAECLVRHGVARVVADRSLPLIFADELRSRGIDVACDRDLGVLDRRRKDAGELAAMRQAQRITEEAVRAACERVARADAADDGTLIEGGEPLTSERVKRGIDRLLLDFDCVADGGHIVAGGPDAADCHFAGRGPLRTGQPVIVDVFPRHKPTGYHGDCTRTVCHGEIPATLAAMHAAVVAAKRAAVDATRAGVTGESVHLAAAAVLRDRGYAVGFEHAGKPGGHMPHGTGHGIGLDLKEPPLLDLAGPPLLAGDVVTIEPALYDLEVGGVRVEDMLVVADSGTENFNALPEGLTWS